MSAYWKTVKAGYKWNASWRVFFLSWWRSIKSFFSAMAMTAISILSLLVIVKVVLHPVWYLLSPLWVAIGATDRQAEIFTANVDMIYEDCRKKTK